MGPGVSADKLLARTQGSKGKAMSDWTEVLCSKLRCNVLLSDSDRGPWFTLNTNMKRTHDSLENCEVSSPFPSLAVHYSKLIIAWDTTSIAEWIRTPTVHIVILQATGAGYETI